jgi:hypothetical protein
MPVFFNPKLGTGGAALEQWLPESSLSQAWSARTAATTALADFRMKITEERSRTRNKIEQALKALGS